MSLPIGHHDCLEDFMRAFRLLNSVILSTLVGGATLVYAQDDKPQQEDKPPRQEEPKPQPKQDEAKPAQQDEAKPAKPEKQEDKEKQTQKEQAGQGQAQQAGKSARIPDDKFRAHFGRSHTFTAKTAIVQGQPQFQYGGYSFQLVDVWPVGWAYTDNCYIDYIDGEYFLFDLLHPGVQVAIVVVM
jgi:hypothetical protein